MPTRSGFRVWDLGFAKLGNHRKPPFHAQLLNLSCVSSTGL
jgi:hypothetical protein